MRGQREYKDVLYRLRRHPDGTHDDEAEESSYRDGRDSFRSIYSSAVVFLVAEWFLRRAATGYPDGALFPVGYLLFWAFYYTYYKPNTLEEHLSETSRWTLRHVGAVFFGVAIWFVKVTVIEFLQVMMLLPRAASEHRSKKRRVPETESRRAARPAATPPPQPKRTTAPPLRDEVAEQTRVFVLDDNGRPRVVVLPREVLFALTTLGLDARSRWNDIHRRYRELAKKHHPDLAGDGTQGQRFLQVDAAYRKLLSVRDRYFLEKTPTRAANS